MLSPLRRLKSVALAGVTIFVIGVACETEVEVPIDRTVEVPVERTVIVTERVEVVRTVEVPTEVEVVRTVEVPIERRVEVLVTPTPAPTPSPGPRIFRLGIFEEPITRNFWNYYGGPGGSVWTQYVLDGVAPTLYTFSDQRFAWIPSVADGFPTPLVQEVIDDETFWTSEVKLRKGLTWSDGVEITADDFVFVVDVALDLELAANWASAVDPAFVDHVEATGSHAIKVFFKGTDAEGNPQTPGLGIWQFGLAFTPILSKQYWEPIVEEAKAAGADVQAQQEALFAHVPEGEPTAGGYTFKRWEPGAFFENEADPNWFMKGTLVTEYSNGAYRETNPALDYDVVFYGDAQGPKSLEFEVGPHADSAIFSIYSNQDSAILALMNGDIDYLFNPLGLQKGFRDRVDAASDLDVLSNPSNEFRYLGFNVRKQPMSIKEFRQAVATVIDKEFVAETVLQGSAIPVYAVVPPGNAFWHNPDVLQIGKGLTRAERIAQAVDLLKSAGFTYETEPQVSEDGNFVEVQARGLKMPDGTPVPKLEIVGPAAGYDPLRATFNIWIERWLNDIGIPAESKLTGFNVIVDLLFSDTVAEDLDMWILGWSLDLFPDYLESFFHSRHGQGGDINWGGYANPEYDKLALELLTETDLNEARRKALILQEFLADDLPYVTLFTSPALDTYRPTKIRFPYTSSLGGIEFVNGLQQEALIE